MQEDYLKFLERKRHSTQKHGIKPLWIPDKPASCWTLETGKIEITVLNSHRDDPGEWVMNCHKIGFNCKRIGVERDTPVILARIAAIDLVKKELRAMLESLES